MSDYKPYPYHRKTHSGQHLKLNDRARMAAEYLSKTQWGTKSSEENEEGEPRRFKTAAIVSDSPANIYNIGRMTRNNLKHVI